MYEKKKQENLHPIDDELLDEVAGGASFEMYQDRWYACRCQDCEYKWEVKNHKPNYCPKCKRNNISIN